MLRDSFAQIVLTILGRTTETPSVVCADIATSPAPVPTPSIEPATTPYPGSTGDNYYVAPYPEYQSSQTAFYAVPKPLVIDSSNGEKSPVAKEPTAASGKSGYWGLATVPLLITAAVWAVALYNTANRNHDQAVAHSKKKFKRLLI